MADEQRLIISLEARMTNYERALERAKGKTRDNFKAMERQAETTAAKMRRAMDGALTSVGTGLVGKASMLAAALAGTVSLASIVEASKEYTALSNALRVTGIEGEALETTLAGLFQIAQRQGTAIAPLVGLYAKLSLAQGELGISGEQLMRFTEGVATALRAGGVSAQDAAGPLLQLSQALGGGIVRAEEFNSLLEGTPTIVQTVARGLKEASGSVAQLRNLVNDGAVSSRAFFDAFNAGFPALAEQAGRASDTTDQGLTRMRNAFVAVVGKLDEAAGASKNAAANLTAVGDAIARLPAFIDAASAGFDKLHSWLASVGNNPIWRQIGEFMGGDYSPEGLARAGIYNPNATAGGIGSDRIAGGEIAASASVAPVSLADYPTEPAKASKPSGAGRHNAQRDYGDVITIANDRIAQLRVEQQALGMTTEAAEGLRLKEELLARVAQEQITLSPQQRADLEAKAAEYGRLTAEIERAAYAQGAIEDIGRSSIGGIIGDLRNGVSVADAFANALNRVLDRLIDLSLDSLFSGGGLSGILGGLFGLKDGGQVPAFAAGGAIQNRPAGRLKGPGTGRSDSILARVSTGEFIVNAAATARHGALLASINAGAKLPAFATGGYAGAAPALPSPVIASRQQAAEPAITINAPVTVNAHGGTPEQNDDLARRTAKAMEGTMRGVVASEIAKQLRPGNMLNNRRF